MCGEAYTFQVPAIEEDLGRMAEKLGTSICGMARNT
jgi:hypothetical protein